MQYTQTMEWSRTGLARMACFVVAVLLLLAPVGAVAQGSNWRDALQGEKAKNADRLAVIVRQGEPIAAKLREVNREVEKHNANQCKYPEDQPEVCAWYVDEKVRLDNATQSLKSQLSPLIDEQEKLQARNVAIDRRLNCVQPPTSCSSNSDCQCSQSCAAFPDGRRSDTGICQPHP